MVVKVETKLVIFKTEKLIVKLVFASNNVHKLDEIRNLAPDGYEIISLNELDCNEEIPETGNTLEENAFQKANFVFEKFRKNCFADDTGLEVEALNGAPGVYSSRYAGENKKSDDNIRKLLKEMENKANRSAQFKTVIAGLINGKKIICKGIIKGEILKVARGESGFGYDPVFMPSGHFRSFAEMSLAEKNKISHRAIAIEKFFKIAQGF